jgi:hypothetical protein
MIASNFEWILRAACGPGSCLVFNLPLLVAAGLAIVLWWYERKGNDVS